MSYTDLETHLNIISCIEVYNDELYMSALSQYYRKNEEGYLIVYKDKETVNFKLVYDFMNKTKTKVVFIHDSNGVARKLLGFKHYNQVFFIDKNEKIDLTQRKDEFNKLLNKKHKKVYDMDHSVRYGDRDEDYEEKLIKEINEMFEESKKGNVKIYYTEKTVKSASENGYVNILDLLWDNRDNFPFKYNSDALLWASKYGHIQVLEWFWNKRNEIPFEYTHEAIDNAACKDKLNVIKWFWKRRNEIPFKISTNAYFWADGNGNNDVVEWLVKKVDKEQLYEEILAVNTEQDDYGNFYYNDNYPEDYKHEYDENKKLID
jgi:hypothetical protein